jgi:hypothetical protein
VIKMGSRIRKAFKKVTKFVDKKVVEPLERPVKSVAKTVDKAIVEPLEKPVKSVAKVVDKAIVEPLERPVKKVAKGVKNIADEAFEELIEKPVKKVAAETFDVVMNTDKEERRAMLGDAPPAPEPEVTPEVTPETAPDEPTIVGRGRRRSKRSGQAGTIMEEYGALTAKAKAKAVERA